MIKTWKEVTFDNLIPSKRNRVIGLSFPEQQSNLGLEPSILTVLPDGDNVEYSLHNIDFNDEDVLYYACAVYISGYDEFKAWALRHDRKKIVVGGYHPTTFPEDFLNYADKIIICPCDNFYDTIEQPGQVVKGITDYNHTPRYDLYDAKFNQQIIPDKDPAELAISINTSQGCPMRCDFCCSPLMCDTLQSKPIDLIKKEVEILKKEAEPRLAKGENVYLFIRDENFPMQKDWVERLELINSIGAKIYLFASANLLNEETVKKFKENNVYMVCLGLEDITETYKKNEKLDASVALLKKYGIYVYLSFIVNPLKIIGREKATEFYDKLMNRFYELKPEMVCGNFLMPFRGTKLWDTYYAFVAPEDYKHYDSKSAFLIKNPIVRKKMEFFMFYYQYLYYTSELYNNDIRTFEIGDTLHLRFEELYSQFVPIYERIWNKRA